MNAHTDKLLASVAAYSSNPEEYERTYAEHLLDRPARFAGQLTTPARILDLGCGPGRDLRIFTQLGHDPVGIDLNPDFVRMARCHGRVEEADFRRVQEYFDAGSFDAIWAQASLVHLAHDDTKRLLRDLFTLLVPGGHIYACVPAAGETGWRLEGDGRRWYAVWPGGSFATAMKESGFQVDDITEGEYIELWASRPVDHRTQ